MMSAATISSHAIIALLAILLAATGAFNSHIPRITSDLNIQPTSSKTSPPSQHRRNEATSLNSWLSDAFQSLGLDLTLEKLKFNPKIPQPTTTTNSNEPNTQRGTVIRTAAKPYHAEHSKPASRQYTTRKEPTSTAGIRLSPDGVQGDYNHYRTAALSSTPDRAVSILTTDILQMLRTTTIGGSSSGWESVADGDLGENIYVDGIDYTFFEVGKRYQFTQGIRQQAANNDAKEGVIVEITERIEPCGNLCKLPFINNESIPPLERMQACKKFLLYLDEKEGLRGWYAKVIGDGGMVKLGDQVSALAM